MIIYVKLIIIPVMLFVLRVASQLVSDNTSNINDTDNDLKTGPCQENLENCTTCSQNCNECEESSGICKMCQKYFFLVDNRLCKDCPNNCEVCESETYCVHCKTGYKGLSCHEECSNCKPNTSCKQDDGYCAEGCTAGLSGRYCNVPCDPKCKSCDRNLNSQCISCADTRYGDTCGKQCSKNCYGDKCDDSNGFCVDSCVNGYWGDTCEFTCPNNCNDNECNRESGNCTHGCFDNKKQILCSLNCTCDLTEMCSFCKEDLKALCEHVCSNGCTGEICHQNRRECLECCKNGYNGSFCVLPSDNTTNVDTIIPDTKSIKWVGLVIGLAALIVVVMTVALIVCAHRNAKVKQSELAGVFFTANQTEAERPNTENFMEDLDDFQAESLTLTIHDEGNTYYNTAALQRRKIQLNKLANYVSNKTAEDFINEFQELPPDLIKPFEESQKECNLSRNRYRGIYPYDSTRVVLKEGISDYINASFVDGYNHFRAYIASLGPTIKFMGDMSPFWNMVWQENCEKIVMLTNLIEGEVSKCDQYWPNVCCTSTYGEINVRCELEHIFTNYVVRYFIIQKKLEKRAVAQFHFTSWPDKGVPEDINGLIGFWNTVNNYRAKHNGPIVVHCSAGVGRTGTFIALDILSNEGKAEGCVDIFACVRNLREQRVKMVQTVEQYEYLHHAVVRLFNV